MKTTSFDSRRARRPALTLLNGGLWGALPSLVLGSLLGLSLAGCAAAPAPVAAPSEAGAASRLQVRNNHEHPYTGPVRFATSLPAGAYASADGTATGVVSGGEARVLVQLPARSAVVLERTGAAAATSPAAGALAAAPAGEAVKLSWQGRELGTLDLGLVAVAGRTGNTSDAVSAYRPLALDWRAGADGVLRATAAHGAYDVAFELLPAARGFADMRATLVRRAGPAEEGYLALVRRLRVPEVSDGRQRFNGRVLDGVDSPETWSRDFWYTRGVDWTSWRTGPVRIAAVHGFTPHPNVQRDTAWGEGSHFWVWEKTRRTADGVLLVSEIAGPNPNQSKSRYMAVKEYAGIEPGDTLTFEWRLAFAPAPEPSWEEMQLRVFSGHRRVAGDVVELGVPHVAFGTAYFPYSTLPENFDFYRTPGLDKETWWPFSPVMWQRWREFIPRMRTDLHIIRAMGFDWVRPHHLELLQQMDRAEAFAFLDFYMNEVRALGMRVMLDTGGPDEWMETLTRRYADVIQRVEMENEVLIGGVRPGLPERWTSLYHAAKRGNPNAQVFLTNAGNHGTFERIRSLGVPFDRIGLHAYKHGPDWLEAFSSHALGSAGYATRLGREVTLGEFNWKEYTRFSPEKRTALFAETYQQMLSPRAIPELFQFQFHETLTVNPSISRSGVRHYETISLDRRPKPEAAELRRLIREYTRPDAPVVTLPIELAEVRFAAGQATSSFTISNRTAAPVTLTLSALSFEGVEARITSDSVLALAPGASARGTIALTLPAGARPGTYHYFVRATPARGGAGPTEFALGWGVAANYGAPQFNDSTVLGSRVRYVGGPAIVRTIDWDRPLAVVFGEDAPVLEMEMAYILANTLQSATGRPVRLSSHADLPETLRLEGTVLVVGTAATNPLIAADAVSDSTGVGVVVVSEGRVQLTGADRQAVQSAAADFVLRYWPNAKDAAVRITGWEKGAALGNRAGVGERDPA